MQFTISVLFLILTFFQVGCSSSQKVEETDGADYNQVYKDEKEKLSKTHSISPGFLLRIRHSADDNITGEYRVDHEGKLKLPYKINIKAAGHSIDDLEKKLEQAYSSYFKTSNSVSVEIVKREYIVEVRGLVQKPGLLNIKLDTSIEEIIAQAGGLTGQGDSTQKESKTNLSSKAEFIRVVTPDFMTGSGKELIRWVRLSDYFARYDIRNEILWKGGETLFFQIAGDIEAMKGQTIQIMGEVHKPGEYPITPGADLHAYIAAAGGPTSQADLAKITIISRISNSSSRYDISNAPEMIPFVSGDIILVKAIDSRSTTAERVLPLALSATSVLVTILLLIFTL